MQPTTTIGILYTVYIVITLSLAGWFSWSVTHKRRIEIKYRVSIIAWIIFLVLVAVAFHVITYVKLPWVGWEIFSTKIKPEKEIVINIEDYEFFLPENPIKIEKGQVVKFTVFSKDVTYGFGVFRENGTMVFQMQVLPAYANELLWIFQEQGSYTIRSTEYSGPENWKMVLRDAIIVSE